MNFVAKNFNKPLTYLLISFIALGCSSEKNKPTRSITPIEKKIYISQGSPMELIRGAETEPLLTLDDENLSAYGEYVITGYSSFSEKAENDTKKNMDDVEEENAAAAGESNPAGILLNQLIFSFHRLDNSRIVFRGKIDLDKLDLDEFGDKTKESIKSSEIRSASVELIFIKEPGGYRASSSITKQNGKIILEEKFKKNINDLIHVSISKDKSAISLLSRDFDAKTGEGLELVYFIQKSPSTIKTGSTNYNYLEGPGVLAKWNTEKNKEIFICGEQSKFLTYPVSKALEEWQGAIQTPLNFKISYTKHYKPFTDLNQNCVFYVKNYRTRTSDSFANYASTFVSRSFFTGDVVSASILFFEEEYLKGREAPEELYSGEESVYQKITRPGFENIYKKSVFRKTKEERLNSNLYENYFMEYALHEFGHLLGLDHTFDGTWSIMSYQHSNGSLAEYDREAIKELYDNDANKYSY